MMIDMHVWWAFLQRMTPDEVRAFETLRHRHDVATEDDAALVADFRAIPRSRRILNMPVPRAGHHDRGYIRCGDMTAVLPSGISVSGEVGAP